MDGLMMLTSEEQVEGVQELVVEDAFVDVEIPELEGPDLEIAGDGQKGKKSELLRNWLAGLNIPNKSESLSLTADELSLLRHLSLFRINNQGVIFRLFVSKKGEVSVLIFLEGEPLKKCVLGIHESLGHGSKKAVFEIMSRRYYATGLRIQIKNILDLCVTCLKYNVHKTLKEGQSSLLSSQSRRVLQMDLLGPLPMSCGFRYIWAGCDSYDRSCYLRGLKGTTADEMCSLLAKFFAEQGKWEILKIDFRCLSFKKIDKKMLDSIGVGVVRSNNCSRQQGQVERLLQTVLIKLLKLMVNEPSLGRWAFYLPLVEFVVNSSPHVSLNWRTPNEIRFRRAPSLFLPPIEKKGGNREFDNLVEVGNDIRKMALKTMLSNKHYYDSGEALVQGTIVWRKRQSFSRHANQKLQFKILEAYVVQGRVGTGLYKLGNVITNETVILPIDQLVRCRLGLQDVKKILQELNA